MTRERATVNSQKKYQIRNKKRVLVSGFLGLLLIVILIFGGVKWIGGGVSHETMDKVLSRVSKDEIKGKDGTSHLIYRTDKWNLVLLNKWNPIAKDLKLDLARLDKGHEIDVRCQEDFLEMMKACQNAGNSPMVVSAYRTFDKQKMYYEGQVQNLIEQGKSEKAAKVEAAKEVALPGTSEHHLGLAVDIVDENMQELDKSQEKTRTQKWLIKNSWKYGFIVRYPKGKEALTGIIYEPWHYRYVGKEAAKEITEKNLCLEEYLANLK